MWTKLSFSFLLILALSLCACTKRPGEGTELPSVPASLRSPNDEVPIVTTSTGPVLAPTAAFALDVPTPPTLVVYQGTSN